MAELTPWERPRGAIHDLARLEELSADRCRILCVSDRTLYLLHNFSALDIAFASRYSVDKTSDGYIAVRPDDEQLFELYLSVVNAFRLEVLDMTCDIESGLNAIADALSGLSINISCGGGGGAGGTVVVDCIENLPNEHLLGPPGDEQGDPMTDPPPDTFATWEEYFTYKCNASFFIWDLVRRYMVACKGFDLMFLTANIVTPIIAGLTGILPAALTPAGFAVLVSSLLAIGAISLGAWFFMDQMIDQWDADKEAIICALYESGTSVEAVAAVANFLEDAIQAIIAWGTLEPIAGEIAALLGEAFGTIAGNGLVQPLFEAAIAVAAYEYDCSDCDQPPAGGDIFLTAQSEPYNVLLEGSSIIFNAEDALKGYQTQNSGQHVSLTFYPVGDLPNWQWSGWISGPDHPGETHNMVAHLWYNEPGVGWVQPRSWGPLPYDTDEWTQFQFDVNDWPLVEGGWYVMEFTLQEFNQFAWWRALVGSST
jgi:hypothetical protein